MNQLTFDFAVAALASYDEDGHAQIQTDSPGEDGQQGTHPAPVVLPLGYHALPLDPEQGSEADIGLGATLLCITSGDHRYVMPLNDPRDVGKFPKVRKGGVMMAGGAGEYRSFFHVDGLDPNKIETSGSILMTASYPKAGIKKSLGLSMNVRTSGEEELSIVHGEGQRITMGASGSHSITLSSAGGDSYVEIGDDGNVLAGITKVQGSLTVGQQLAALPVASAPPVIAALALIAGVIAAMVPELVSKTVTLAPTLPALAAPLAGLAALLPKINALHLKAT
jgi:hypothetical protein